MRRATTVLALTLALAAARPTGAQAPVLHERLPDSLADEDLPSFDGDELSLGEDDVAPPGVGDEAGDGGGFSVDAVPRLSPPGDVELDGDTGRDEVLTYFAVFDPSVAPFKRSYVRDRLRADGALVIADGALRPLPAARRSQRPDRDLFWGSLLVELADARPVPIPSVAPTSAVLELETVPSVPVELLVDGADNLYLRSTESARVRLNLLLDAPPTYFGGPLPDDVTLGDLEGRPPLPPAFREAGRRVFAAIRRRGGAPAAAPADVSVAAALTLLTGHFRAFEPGRLLHVPDDPVARYEAIALGGRGVCRHRAYAFVVTAQALGLPARYVANEAHAFAEVRLPDGSWRRVDLGGGAAGFDVRGASHRSRHVPDRADPLPRPDAYASSYSAPPAVVTARTGGGAAADGRGPALRAGRGGAATILPALVTLDRTSAHVFRGEPLTVSGRVRMPGGPPPPDRLVEVLLVSYGPGESARRLGLVPTGRGGRFMATLRVPPTIPPGRYGLAARYLGLRDRE